jgi:hypothetical protein
MCLDPERARLTVTGPSTEMVTSTLWEAWLAFLWRFRHNKNSKSKNKDALSISTIASRTEMLLLG